MMTKTLRYGKGYAGKLGNRCWIARITGTDSHYGLARTFLEADRVEREHFNRARTMIDLSWDLTDGLYECSAGGDRWFSLVWTDATTGAQKSFRPDDARVVAIAAMLDAGQDFDAARKATKRQATPSVDAQAVQS